MSENVTYSELSEMANIIACNTSETALKGAMCRFRDRISTRHERQPPASEPKDTRCPSQMADGGCNESPEVDEMRERIAELEAEVERLKARPVVGMPSRKEVEAFVRDSDWGPEDEVIAVSNTVEDALKHLGLRVQRMPTRQEWIDAIGKHLGMHNPSLANKGKLADAILAKIGGQER